MSWIKHALDNRGKILALSPMADMTDSAFCQVVRNIGGADVVYREMVSAEALVRDSEKTLGMTDFVEGERPIVQQIFGADPLTMARAAEIVMKHAGPEGIDINMGCPVYKITSNFNGCALMKDPTLASNIIKEMKRAIGETPLSVKIRLGWDDPDSFKTFIPAIEAAGAELITIHGRTKAQGYSGVSDWERIRQAKEIATVPLLANGDIHEPRQVWEALEQTGADGVLIARGALGNPWFFAQALSLRGAQRRRGNLVEVGDSSTSLRSDQHDVGALFEDRIRVILEHARLHVENHARLTRLVKKGKIAGITAEELEKMTIVTFRKHLAWYFKSTRFPLPIPGIKEYRAELVRINSIEELEEILQRLQGHIQNTSI